MKSGRALIFFAIAGAVIIPFIPLILWSISGKWFFPALYPQEFSLRAWQYIFTTASGQITSGLYESLKLALVTTAASLILGLPAGRALGLYNFPGKKFAALLLMLPIIVPPLSVAMGLQFWFIRLGLAETFIGVVLLHLTVCLPYTIFVFWGVFSDYDPDFELQARSLGASPLRTSVLVMIPMILPGITVAALFSFLLSWSQYLSTLIIGGGKILTLPLLLFSLMSSGDRPVAGAVSLVFILPVFFVLLCSTGQLGRHGLRGIR
jgi:putative spermidine/putrescine transport system permease protein